MTSDLDIYRSASLLIDLHGQGAIIDTTVRVDAPRVAGDLDVHARVAAGQGGDAQPAEA